MQRLLRAPCSPPARVGCYSNALTKCPSLYRIPASTRYAGRGLLHLQRRTLSCCSEFDCLFIREGTLVGVIVRWPLWSLVACQNGSGRQLASSPPYPCLLQKPNSYSQNRLDHLGVSRFAGWRFGLSAITQWSPHLAFLPLFPLSYC